MANENVVEPASYYTQLEPGFQTTVRNRMGFGMPGEIRVDGPWRAESHVFNGGGVVGNAVALTKSSNGIWSAKTKSITSSDLIIGILSTPKEQVNAYAITQRLDAAPLTGSDRLGIMNGAVGTVLTMGCICVLLNNAANPGDYVECDSFGNLYAVAYVDAQTTPEASASDRFIMPNARIMLNPLLSASTTDQGLAIVKLTN